MRKNILNASQKHSNNVQNNNKNLKNVRSKNYYTHLFKKEEMKNYLNNNKKYSSRDSL